MTRKSFTDDGCSLSSLFSRFRILLRLLGLEVLLEVMHATVEAAKLVDALLVLETHLHVVVVVVRLRARTRGVSRGVGARAREERRTIVWRTRVREVAVE